MEKTLKVSKNILHRSGMKIHTLVIEEQEGGLRDIC